MCGWGILYHTNRSYTLGILFSLSFFFFFLSKLICYSAVIPCLHSSKYLTTVITFLRKWDVHLHYVLAKAYCSPKVSDKQCNYLCMATQTVFALKLAAPVHCMKATPFSRDWTVVNLSRAAYWNLSLSPSPYKSDIVSVPVSCSFFFFFLKKAFGYIHGNQHETL